MTCKILARHASDLQEKVHFSCKNLASARTLQKACKPCKSRASFLQDLLALHARYTCKSCKTCKKTDIYRARILQTWTCKTCRLFFHGEEKNKKKADAVRKRSITSKITWKNTNVEHKNMSESDELVEPSTSKLLKEAEQSEDGGVDNEDAVCCECSVSYEHDVCNGYGEEWVCCDNKRWIHVNCIDEVIWMRMAKNVFAHVVLYNGSV